jgi:hypothetical protein
LRHPRQREQQRAGARCLREQPERARRGREGEPGQQRQWQGDLHGEDHAGHGAAPGKRMSLTSAMKKAK